MTAPSLIDSLPGISLPISKVLPMLSQMWDSLSSKTSGSSTPDFRALQMNLIVHFLPDVTEQEALKEFNTALSFSHTHPCRIIVLCPSPNALHMEAKVFSQCYIGEGTHNISSCDALLLSYPQSEHSHTQNQVSIWLDNDLPIYYWLKGVPHTPITVSDFSFFSLCTKILYDSDSNYSIYSSIPWPKNLNTQDFAFVRMLPARQSLGQFLSMYSPSHIVDGLEKIELHYPASLIGQAHTFMHWISNNITSCMQPLLIKKTVEYVMKEETSSHTFTLQFIYNHTYSLKWTYTPSLQSGTVEANFGQGNVTYPLKINNLGPQSVLNQAIFY